MNSPDKNASKEPEEETEEDFGKMAADRLSLVGKAQMSAVKLVGTRTWASEVFPLHIH